MELTKVFQQIAENVPNFPKDIKLQNQKLKIRNRINPKKSTSIHIKAKDKKSLANRLISRPGTSIPMTVDFSRKTTKARKWHNVIQRLKEKNS